MNEEIESNDTLEQQSEEISGIDAMASNELDYKDAYLRLLAEVDNTKKILKKDSDNAVKFAIESFAKEILVLVDNLDNALKLDMSNELRDGLNLVKTTFSKTMNKFNVVEVEYVDFDPNYHEAVCTIPGEKNGSILDVYRSGWKIKDKLLRPALVSVVQ